MYSPILIFSFGAFLSTMAGGLLASRSGARFGTITAFAAGVLIAVPLFDLLPESIKLAQELNISIKFVMTSAALGFVFIYIIERYFSVHHVCEENICHNVRHPKGGLFGAAELSAHSFMDGFAIGMGFNMNSHAGIIIAVAVLSHDFSDGINTFTIMRNAGNSGRSSMKMLILDAVAPVLGAISTLFIKMPEGFLVFILPFFAGGFLYLGAGDLLPEAHEKNPPMVSLFSTLGGFVLIFLITEVLNV